MTKQLFLFALCVFKSKTVKQKKNKNKKQTNKQTNKNSKMGKKIIKILGNSCVFF